MIVPSHLTIASVQGTGESADFVFAQAKKADVLFPVLVVLDDEAKPGTEFPSRASRKKTPLEKTAAL